MSANNLQDGVLPIHLMTTLEWRDHQATMPAAARSAAMSAPFRGEPGTYVMIHNAAGEPSGVLAGRAAGPNGVLALRALAARLPEGEYELWPPPGDIPFDRAVTEWAAGTYRFDRYKRPSAEPRAAPRLRGPALEAGGDDRRGLCAGPRSHQYACQRPGAKRGRGRGSTPCGPLWRRDEGCRGR